MGKYIKPAIALVATCAASFFFRANTEAFMIVIAIGATICGYCYGVEATEEYYDTPQYIICSEEKLKKMANDILNDSEDKNN